MAPTTPLTYEEVLMFMRSAPANIFFKDTACRYRFVSNECALLKGRQGEVYGKTDLEIQIDRSRGQFYYEQDRRVLATGKGCEYVTQLELGGDQRWYQIKKNPVYLEGQLVGIVGFIDDITSRIALEKQIEELSFKDPLTGLYNRTYLEVRVKPALKAAKLPVTVIMADCNYLKKTNDTYGHEYGDLLLKRVARILRSALPEGCTALRIGGDEFMILCEDCDEQKGKELVEDIQRRFAKESDDRIPLSVAFGAHTTAAGAFSFAEAYRRADRAMYEHKRKMRSAR